MVFFIITACFSMNQKLKIFCIIKRCFLFIVLRLRYWHIFEHYFKIGIWFLWPQNFFLLRSKRKQWDYKYRWECGLLSRGKAPSLVRIQRNGIPMGGDGSWSYEDTCIRSCYTQVSNFLSLDFRPYSVRHNGKNYTFE